MWRLVRRRLWQAVEVRSACYNFAMRWGLQWDIHELPRLTRHFHSGPRSPGGGWGRLRGLLRCPELQLQLLWGFQQRRRIRFRDYTFAMHWGLQQHIHKLPCLTRHFHSGPRSPGGGWGRLRGLLWCPELQLRLLRGLRQRQWTRYRDLLFDLSNGWDFHSTEEDEEAWYDQYSKFLDLNWRKLLLCAFLQSQVKQQTNKKINEKKKRKKR